MGKVLGEHFRCELHPTKRRWWTITRIRDGRVMSEGEGSRAFANRLWRMFEEGERETQDRPSNWPGNRKRA